MRRPWCPLQFVPYAMRLSARQQHAAITHATSSALFVTPSFIAHCRVAPARGWVGERVFYGCAVPDASWRDDGCSVTGVSYSGRRNRDLSHLTIFTG